MISLFAIRSTRPIASFKIILAAVCGVLSIGLSLRADAAESGFGVYLLGSRGPSSGYIPHPGFYLASQQFHYRGNYSGPISLIPGTITDAHISVATDFNMLSPVWITDKRLFGGRLGFSATLPVGQVNVALNAPGVNTEEKGFWIGDPLFSSFVGWSYQNFHWNAGVTLVAPIGQYDSTRLSNLSLNRPAVDVFGALSWIDLKTGIDISGALGLTVNGENTETNYRSGTELHAEWSVSKALTPALSVGAMGYHYQQLTDDSGQGASLGGFRGQATAIGGFLNYRFQIDKRLVSLRAQALREFNVENRFRGTPVSLHLVVELGP